MIFYFIIFLLSHKIKNLHWQLGNRTNHLLMKIVHGRKMRGEKTRRINLKILKDILTCHSLKSRGVHNKINNGWIPCSCCHPVDSRAHCHTVMWLTHWFSCYKSKISAVKWRVLVLVWLQVLQRGGGGSLSLWHCQTPHLWERGALAEGAEGPRRQQHRHHAGWQQERPAPPQGRAHRWGPGLRRYRKLDRHIIGNMREHVFIILTDIGWILSCVPLFHSPHFFPEVGMKRICREILQHLVFFLQIFVVNLSCLALRKVTRPWRHECVFFLMPQRRTICHS